MELVFVMWSITAVSGTVESPMVSGSSKVEHSTIVVMVDTSIGLSVEDSPAAEAGARRGDGADADVMKLSSNFTDDSLIPVRAQYS